VANAQVDPEPTLRHEGHNTTVYWRWRSARVENSLWAWNHGRIEEAVVKAERAMRKHLHPSDGSTAAAIVCIGRTQLQQPEAALSYCHAAVRISGGRDWRHLNNRANALLQVGQFDQAINDYEQAVGLLAAEISSAKGDSRAALQRALDDVLLAHLDLARRRQAPWMEGVALAAPGPEPEHEDSSETEIEDDSAPPSRH
jgi:tetratricopeptide (TPR) repeat protein